MSPNDEGALFQIGIAVDNPNALGFQKVHDLLVMDHGTKGEYGTLAPVRLQEHDLDCPANTHAETCSLGKLHLQNVSISSEER